MASQLDAGGSGVGGPGADRLAARGKQQAAADVTYLLNVVAALGQPPPSRLVAAREALRV